MNIETGFTQALQTFVGMFARGMRKITAPRQRGEKNTLPLMEKVHITHSDGRTETVTRPASLQLAGYTKAHLAELAPLGVHTGRLQAAKAAGITPRQG